MPFFCAISTSNSTGIGAAQSKLGADALATTTQPSNIICGTSYPLATTYLTTQNPTSCLVSPAPTRTTHNPTNLETKAQASVEDCHQ
jgi:hypothetical protein